MSISFRPIAGDIGLFAVAVLSADLASAMLAGDVATKTMMAAFHLLAFVHIGASLYVGGYDRLRTISWVLLILAWAATEAAAFARLALPMGQTLFWIATHMPALMPAIAWLAEHGQIVPSLLLAILGFDVLAAQRHRWRDRAAMLVLWIATAFAIAWALRLLSIRLLATPAPSLPGFDILPPWHLLPFYAMVRAVPDKTLGMLVLLAALLAPAMRPWIVAPSPGAGWRSWLWHAGCLAFAGAFIGLSYLGARTPDAATILASRTLGACYFTGLLILPAIAQHRQARLIAP
jgi:quinol-cytochrome oxidoreductase complex cytochrome b subunit